MILLLEKNGELRKTTGNISIEVSIEAEHSQLVFYDGTGEAWDLTA